VDEGEELELLILVYKRNKLENSYTLKYLTILLLRSLFFEGIDEEFIKIELEKHYQLNYSKRDK